MLQWTATNTVLACIHASKAERYLCWFSPATTLQWWYKLLPQALHHTTGLSVMVQVSSSSSPSYHRVVISVGVPDCPRVHQCSGSPSTKRIANWFFVCLTIGTQSTGTSSWDLHDWKQHMGGVSRSESVSCCSILSLVCIHFKKLPCTIVYEMRWWMNSS